MFAADISHGWMVGSGVMRDEWDVFDGRLVFVGLDVGTIDGILVELDVGVFVGSIVFKKLFELLYPGVLAI